MRGTASITTTIERMPDSKQQLESFRSEFSSEFAAFDSAWRSALTSSIPLIDKMIGYLTDQRGKGLRPLICFLSARVYGTPTPATIQSALVMELLHSATLIHDDVVDNSDTRRGFASLKAVWGNKISVLFGDFLLARSLEATIEMRKQEALSVLSEIASRMGKGQLHEAAISKDLNCSEEEYTKMISDKTAALISGAIRLGVLTTGPDTLSLEQWKLFGESLGIAFQIRDDILDYTGRSGLLGKPVGGDIKDSKITLPLIYAFQNAGDTAASGVLGRFRAGLKRRDIKDIVQFVVENNGIELAQKRAEAYANQAIVILETETPAGHARDRLKEFVRFSVEREY